MKNLLIRWEIKEENRKISDNVSFIDRKYSGNVLLIDRECSGTVLFIDRELIELEDDTEYASFSKLIKLVKKSFNPTRTEKEKLYLPISHSLTRFDKPVR